MGDGVMVMVGRGFFGLGGGRVGAGELRVCLYFCVAWAVQKSYGRNRKLYVLNLEVFVFN